MIWTLRPRCWPINGLLAASGYAYNTDLVSAPCAEEEMDWTRVLAYITATVDQELLSRDDYLVTENRILKRQLEGRLLRSDAERVTLGEIGHRLGHKALSEVANAAKPDTILGGRRRARIFRLEDDPHSITLTVRCGQLRQGTSHRRGNFRAAGNLPPIARSNRARGAIPDADP
jgi:hypothetical protein